MKRMISLLSLAIAVLILASCAQTALPAGKTSTTGETAIGSKSAGASQTPVSPAKESEISSATESEVLSATESEKASATENQSSAAEDPDGAEPRKLFEHITLQQPLFAEDRSSKSVEPYSRGLIELFIKNPSEN